MKRLADDPARRPAQRGGRPTSSPFRKSVDARTHWRRSSPSTTALPCRCARSIPRTAGPEEVTVSARSRRHTVADRLDRRPGSSGSGRRFARRQLADSETFAAASLEAATTTCERKIRRPQQDDEAVPLREAVEADPDFAHVPGGVSRAFKLGRDWPEAASSATRR